MAASADDTDTAKLVAECSGADLPQASVDSCLERARVLEETSPSSQLQTLEAALEQRESGRPASLHSAAAAPRTIEIAPEPAPAPESANGPDQSVGRDQSVASPADSERSADRSGGAFEDEPPVSDSPDTPAGTDRSSDDEASDPPQS